jgi:hypothetical protein
MVNEPLIFYFYQAKFSLCIPTNYPEAAVYNKRRDNGICQPKDGMYS